MKKLFALILALILGLCGIDNPAVVADVTVNPEVAEQPAEQAAFEWRRGYKARCRKNNNKQHKKLFQALLDLLIPAAKAEDGAPTEYVGKHQRQRRKAKMDGVAVINDGNPVPIGEGEYMFTTSPSGAKRKVWYCTDKPVPLTEYEKKMPGVVICQNRGMLFSSHRPIKGYSIPDLKALNVIIVDEKSTKYHPTEDDMHKIAYNGDGAHVVKETCSDGAGVHFFKNKKGKLAKKLWFKPWGPYGLKGMLQPGNPDRIGQKVIDHWGVERTITLGDTLLMNSSMVKGINAYDSLEEWVEHCEDWGLTTIEAQWQSGCHKVENRRIIGTQANAGNFALTKDEVKELQIPEMIKIWAMKFPRAAWMRMANIRTSRGRAFAARPSLMYHPLVKQSVDDKAGNDFLRVAQGKVMAKARYYKIFPDLEYHDTVYVDGMSVDEAARKVAENGLHGEIRVHASVAKPHKVTDENGINHVEFKEETFLDEHGRRYMEMALVRYPHGAPSETIIVRAYLTWDIPEDVMIIPGPVANKDGDIPVKALLCLRLQGADFDGDSVTAFFEKIWVEAQKRNEGMPYMIIPINTVSTEKDKTLVTDETFAEFCAQKVESLSNRVGLIATSLKYFLSQCATMIRLGVEPGVVIGMIVNHACAMGDDIDEFKHGKSTNTLVPFVVTHGSGKEETLRSPYFNKFAKKYKSEEDFLKACFYKDKAGNYTVPKNPGQGVLDMYAVGAEKLAEEANLPVVKEVSKASDGTDRYYFTVHPVQWEDRNVDLHITKGEGGNKTALPSILEEIYGVKHGTEFSAKELFQLLYRCQSAANKTLLNSDKDHAIKNLVKVSEMYGLAKVAVIAWTKAMKAKKGIELNAVEAMRVFATIMVQHQEKLRSPLETLTQVGVCTDKNGEPYERTTFKALRCLNYFLDVCGDGLLFAGVEEPEFAKVSQKVIDAAGVKVPDIEEAKEKAAKELDLLDSIVNMLNDGEENVMEAVNELYCSNLSDEDIPADDDMSLDELFELVEDGSFEFSSEPIELTDDEIEFARQMAEEEYGY